MIDTLTPPINRVLDLLGRDKVKRTGKGWTAKCPAHDDRHPSLTISEGDDGRVLLCCQSAKCTTKEVCAALGLSERDLFRHDDASGNGHKRIVATYPYHGPDGELLYEAVRYQPKSFRQRRPDGKGDWLWNMDGISRVLYRLVQLREADPGAIVFIAEGEKDCDRLAEVGLISTCNVGGAGKWRPEYNEVLRDRRVCIPADKDDAGRKHAQQVAASLNGTAANVKVLELPGDGVKDASDYFNVGGTAEALLKLVEDAPTWKPETAEKSEPKTVRQLMQEFPHLRPPVIHGLLRRGETMNIIAPPKTGKSWLVTDLAIAVALGRVWLGKFQTEAGDVLILDNELHGETSAARIPKVAGGRGVLVDEFADHVSVINLRGKLQDIFSLHSLFDSITPGRFKVIILDAFYRFMPRDADENDNATMAGVYSQLDSYADRLGCCFVLIHHQSKGNQSDKAITDIGAGAGAQSRATDTHLVLRQHEADGAVVLDAAVRSWPPVEPFALRWTFPCWNLADDLDPTQLRRPGGRKRAEPVEQTPKAEPWTMERFVSTFISPQPKTEAAIISAAIGLELSERKAGLFLRAAVDGGSVYRWEFTDRKKPHQYANIPQPVTATGGAI